MSDLQLSGLQAKLGYKFKNQALLELALTHSSYANEMKKSGVVSNERLEFLGDSILGMTVASMLYENYPEMPEGKMTRLRSELVCEKSLAAFSVTFGIGERLLLGRGEVKGGGRDRPSILADAFEAVLAAIYLDGGFRPVAKLIKKYFAPQATVLQIKITDYKTALQEVIQEKSGQALSYSITDESGPDHMKSFTVEVCLNGKRIGSGTGRSKKAAEQSAAMVALQTVQNA